MHLKPVLIGSLLFAGTFLSAQPMREHPPLEEARNKGKAFLLHLEFGIYQPGGDLADRFGGNGGLGLGTEFITANNLIIGAEGHFYFGSNVKEDPLAILRTAEGDLIGNDLSLASVPLHERGWYVGGLIGNLLPLSNTRSGLRITLGAGVTQHKIRVQDDQSALTQITGDYGKGYDRLTGGLALEQFVGWQNLAKNRLANFMIGFEFNQGFTHTLRDWDFNDRRKLEGQRLDLRFGIRAAWTLPFYLDGSENISY
ncbi:MAG: hypothetical protein ABIO24_01565 [Saprospiraceae bacterium]